MTARKTQRKPIRIQAIEDEINRRKEEVRAAEERKRAVESAVIDLADDYSRALDALEAYRRTWRELTGTGAVTDSDMRAAGMSAPEWLLGDLAEDMGMPLKRRKADGHYRYTRREPEDTKGDADTPDPADTGAADTRETAARDADGDTDPTDTQAAQPAPGTPSPSDAYRPAGM